jgi:hypothetical protein
MSCNTCDKVDVIDFPAEGLEFSLPEGRVVFETRTGTTVGATECVVRRPFQPSGGWGVSFRLKGQKVLATGRTPGEIARQAKSLLKLNEIEVSDRDLWFNLNIVWASRCNVKHLLVPLSQLLSVARCERNLPVSDSQRVNLADPAEALEKAWYAVTLYLSRDDYSWAGFKNVLNEMIRVFDPQTCSIYGNNYFYQKIFLSLEGVLKSPVYNRDEAREAYYALKTDVNTRLGFVTASFEEEQKSNHWIQ